MILYLSCVILSFLVSPCLGLASITSNSNKLSSKRFSKDYANQDGKWCIQEAECIPLNNATCFGTGLPYSSTSIELAEDSHGLSDVQENLALWQGLRSVPRCWAVVQPLLCAVYLPKCENGSVFLPTQDMCRSTRGPCKSVEMDHGWPSFLQCEDEKLFPPKCRNPLQEVKFNTSFKCLPPLVETDNPENWYNEVEGCGIQCQDPFFTKEEHDNTHYLISILASVCFCLNVFSMFTFMVCWSAATRYSGLIIFYINLCMALVSFGWIIQFFQGARNEIVCSNDGTIRRKQPNSGQHLCSITFVLTYYFLIAAMVWFVILTYALHVIFKQTGSPEDIVKKKKSYFHISAWSFPLVLTTTVMAMSEVDGNSMSGICFVGYANMYNRIAFVLVPIGLAGVIGCFFLACILYTLHKLKSKEVATIAKKKIRHVNFKIGAFSVLLTVILICTFACHAYDFMNRKEWDEKFREYLVCRAKNSASFSELSTCVLKSKPSIGVFRLQLFCLFGFGILMATWVWTKESVESWKCFFYRFCGPTDKGKGLKKHRIISKAFGHRHEINQGHISFSLNSTHDDPIGMHLDANSVASRDISSSWAVALPRFLVRRDAVAGVVPFSPRHYSSVSEMSRHISMDSFNLPNQDSLSMQMSEQEYAFRNCHQRRKTRKDRERFLKANRNAPWFPDNRRGSDTSLQSSLMAASLAAAVKKAGVGAKVTKSTSTGDLGITHPQPMPFPLVMMPPVNNRPHIQRPAINHPFTHGMTDNSHTLDNRVPSVTSVLPGTSSSLQFTPNQCSMIPNPHMGMLRHPYGSYDRILSMPYGFLGSSMFPSMNGMYPGYSYNPEYPGYPYNPFNTLPFAGYNACSNQYQQDILPMQPMVDSSSEADFFPIRMSDSEYDTGHRSYDDSQLMTTHRLMMEQHLQAQNAAAAAATAALSAASGHPKPGLEPQACAKTQFLQRMGTFNTKTNLVAPQTSRPPSGRKSPHSEAPPPSPAASSKSLNDEDLDDVFNENIKEQKDLSACSLPNTESENVFQRIKSTFKRATSFIQNLEKPESIELSTKTLHNSLDQLSKASSEKKSSVQKELVKQKGEKCLHPSEGQSLINVDAIAENVSR